MTYSCRRRAGAAVVVLTFALVAASAVAGPRDQAKRIHDRLIGVPPSAAELGVMETMVINGDALGAAMRAMDHPLFYSSALKNFITPWTNEEQTVHAPLNDYTATVIGIIRDNRPFTDVLTGDVVYVGGAGGRGSARVTAREGFCGRCSRWVTARSSRATRASRGCGALLAARAAAPETWARSLTRRSLTSRGRFHRSVSFGNHLGRWPTRANDFARRPVRCR